MPPWRLLLLFYLIIPCGFAVALLDTWLLTGAVARALPFKMNEFLWFGFLFGFPHILASNSLLLNREYSGIHRYVIGAALAAAAAVLLLQPALPADLWKALVLVFSLKHLMGQQFGMTRSYFRGPARAYGAWVWLSFAFVIFYTLVTHYSWPVGGSSVVLWSTLAYAALAVPLCAHGVRGVGVAGASLWLANQTLVLSTAAFFLWGYSAIGFFFFRFVHDLTAFTVYSLHNAKRGEEPLSGWLGLRALKPRTAVALTIAVPLTITFFLQLSQSQAVLALMSGLALMHYYLEGIVWQRGSPVRARLDAAYA